MRMIWLTIFSILCISCTLNGVSSMNEAVSNYVSELNKETPLNFRVIVTKNTFHGDGSVKHSDTLVYASKDSKPAEFKLNSLGKKRVEHLIKKTEDKGLALSLLHENFIKNKTKDYDTPALSPLDSPAERIVSNKEGYGAGVIAELIDTLDETTNEAKIEALEYFPSKTIKRRTSLSILAKEVSIKHHKGFSKKMIEDGKKIIKRAFKIDVDDRALIIVRLLEEKFPNYTWSVYINPVTYTAKCEVMADFVYDKNHYVLLGSGSS